MDKKTKKSIYSDLQKTYLREGLCVAKSNQEKETNISLSWSDFNTDVASEIPPLIDLYPEWIPKGFEKSKKIYLNVNDHFRNFAQNSIIKSTGLHEDLTDGQCVAIDLWLSDPNNPYSELSRQKLYGESVQQTSREAVIFSNLLRKNAIGLSLLSAQKFKKKYSSCTIKNMDGNHSIQYTENLLFVTKKDDRHPYILLVKITGTRELTGSRHNWESLNQIGLSKEFELTGWLAISPEDNLFLFMKDSKYGKNYFTVPFSVNESAFTRAGMVSTISLAESMDTIAYQYTENLSNSNGVLREWAEESESKLLIYNSI